MTSVLGLVVAAALFQEPSCEGLKSLSTPKATITAAETIIAAQPAPGGRGQAAPMPAHCRRALTLKPASDSSIAMALWLPENWNGKYLGVGNGGWAGTIQTAAIAAGIRRGYATASNDTGHKGGSASFAVGH